MSTDEDVTKELLETLADGKEGFAKGAEKLQSDSPDVAATFRTLSEQRDRFATELQELAKDYGDQVHESGSTAATFHRGWMALRDALAGSKPSGVLSAAEQGEDHAEKEYENALAADISAGLRVVVERQAQEIKAAHAQVKALSEAQ